MTNIHKNTWIDSVFFPVKRLEIFGPVERERVPDIYLVDREGIAARPDPRL
jgi:hypothetical protein